MHRVVKTAFLGFGLTIAAGVAAQAQSVSSLPPSSGGQTAITQPYGSTQSYFPKPGGSETLRQAPSNRPSTAADDPSVAPYSAKNFGPKPN
jgi:hypothetical protein